MCLICDGLWENPAKVARQNSQKKGKNGKSKKEIFFCLGDQKYVLLLLIHFIHSDTFYAKHTSKCKNIFSSALKLHLMSLKLIVLVFQYNS
jgi:hypothetical protein